MDPAYQQWLMQQFMSGGLAGGGDDIGGLPQPVGASAAPAVPEPKISRAGDAIQQAMAIAEPEDSTPRTSDYAMSRIPNVGEPGGPEEFAPKPWAKGAAIAFDVINALAQTQARSKARKRDQVQPQYQPQSIFADMMNREMQQDQQRQQIGMKNVEIDNREVMERSRQDQAYWQQAERRKNVIINSVLPYFLKEQAPEKLEKWEIEWDFYARIVRPKLQGEERLAADAQMIGLAIGKDQKPSAKAEAWRLLQGTDAYKKASPEDKRVVELAFFDAMAPAGKGMSAKMELIDWWMNDPDSPIHYLDADEQKRSTMRLMGALPKTGDDPVFEQFMDRYLQLSLEGDYTQDRTYRTDPLPHDDALAVAGQEAENLRTALGSVSATANDRGGAVTFQYPQSDFSQEEMGLTTRAAPTLPGLAPTSTPTPAQGQSPALVGGSPLSSLSGLPANPAAPPPLPSQDMGMIGAVEPGAQGLIPGVQNPAPTSPDRAPLPGEHPAYGGQRGAASLSQRVDEPAQPAPPAIEDKFEIDEESLVHLITGFKKIKEVIERDGTWVDPQTGEVVSSVEALRQAFMEQYKIDPYALER